MQIPLNNTSPGLKNSMSHFIITKSRPQNLKEVVSQNEVVKSFKGMLATKTMPHLLLYGPPGTGKTSIILAFAKELFGMKYYKKRILELNASDDRGIGKIREKVQK